MFLASSRGQHCVKLIKGKWCFWAFVLMGGSVMIISSWQLPFPDWLLHVDPQYYWFVSRDWYFLSIFVAQIKSVLIQLYARPKDAVLDIACGKVSSMNVWDSYCIYTMLPISSPQMFRLFTFCVFTIYLAYCWLLGLFGCCCHAKIPVFCILVHVNLCCPFRVVTWSNGTKQKLDITWGWI